MGHVWEIVIGLAEINLGIILIICGIINIFNALKG